MNNEAPSRLEMIWTVVNHIPPGRTISYGEVARRAGLPGLSRYVGYALGQLPPGSRVPWYRVINSQRKITFAPGSAAADRQKALLMAEGVPVQNYRVSREFFEG